MGSQSADLTPDIPLHLRKDQVDRACLETLNINARRTLLANIFISALVATVFWVETDSKSAFVWLGANVLVCGFRLLDLLDFPDADAPSNEFKKVARRYIIGGAVGGAVWGAAAIMYLAPEAQILDAFIIICLMGIGTGSSSSLSAHFPTYVAFITPALVPLLLQLALRGEFVNSVLGLMGIVFTAILIASARSTNRTLRSSFEEKFKSDALAKDLKASRDKLEHSEARFRGFAESSSDWLWEMDEQLRISSLSGRFEAVTGRPTAAAIGKTRNQLTDPQAIIADPEKWRRHFDDLAAHKPFRDFQYEILPDFGGRAVTVSISGIPFFDETGMFKGYRGTGANVTELHEAQKNLYAAKEEAETANRAKSDFLSSMSHELRTPLNAILGFTQLLQMDPSSPLSKEQKESTDQVLRSGQHLLELIDQVLELAKIETGKFTIKIEATSIQQMLRESIAMILPMAKMKNITVTANEDDWLVGEVLVDRTGIKQVLLNFLSNAVKYNRHGGSISVMVRAADVGNIRVEVSDTGPGIALDRQNEIFEPFNRLGHEASEIEGTGIGLVITRKLLHMMDGDIGFESEEGKGSVFWFDVPAA